MNIYEFPSKSFCDQGNIEINNKKYLKFYSMFGLEILN
jgi:hypothetical protein